MRNLLLLLIAFGRPLLAAMLLTPVALFGSSSQTEGERVAPAAALEMLMQGNVRFLRDGGKAHAVHLKKRDASAEAQKPFAIIVSCSDSRVPPELVFDQSVGDLFVVRTAGHVVDEVALGSIEYAVEHLGCPLILVLGHERCGAVTAACSEEEAHGHLAAVLNEIRRSVPKVRRKDGDAVEAAVLSHIDQTVLKLTRSTPVLAPVIAKGILTVRGARYDLDSGKVELTQD